MAYPDPPEDADGQDLAETFDETNITEDGGDIATSDMQRDVLDVTAAEDDADEDDARAAPESRGEEFDPDSLDEAEYEEVVMADEDLDEPRSFAGDDADRVLDAGDGPAGFESDSREDADQEDPDDRPAGAAGQADQRTERRLDEALRDTFPASDPVSIQRPKP